MKTSCLQFDTDAHELLKSLIGQTFLQYSCQPSLEPDVAVYNIGLEFDTTSLKLVNDFVVLEMDGTDDYATFSLAEKKPLEPYLVGKKFVSHPVQARIMDIHLVTDTISWVNEGAQYTLIVDSALIFLFDHTALAFQKDIWFSEDILIFKGADCETQLIPIEEHWDFDPEACARYERRVRTLK